MIEISQQEIKDVTARDIKRLLNLPTVEEAPVAVKPKYWSQTDRYKALVNPENGQLYAIHTSAYRTVPHEEGLFNVLQAVAKNPEFGTVRVERSDYGDFKRFHGKLIFIDQHYPIKEGDIINPSIEYYNSYDGSWSEKITFGAFRVICRNGLVVGERFLTSMTPHLGQQREQLFIYLDQALEQFSMQIGIWQSWLDKELSISHLDVLEDLGLNKSEHEELVEQTEPQMDLWTFYNLITTLITHRMASLNRRVSTWNHLRAKTEEW